ncbi:MAG: hypothetical protein RLZZ74_2747 [Cyanobacteriota bacterium]|jgi:hypothetical protein
MIEVFLDTSFAIALSIDEAQPVMLRRLIAIENKVDTLIERNQ